MKVISLFDGMGCLMMALLECGIKPEKYFACETDKHAIRLTKHLFPDVIHLGCVKRLRNCLVKPEAVLERLHKASWIPEKTKKAYAETEYLISIHGLKNMKFDLVAGGSPCQSFSIAGARKGFKDPRGKLFFDYVDIRNHYSDLNPDMFFFLENVARMSKEVKQVFTQYMIVKPARINSNLVSAQNRDRLYFSNSCTVQDSIFYLPQTYMPHIKDRGIVIADILEDEVDDKYIITNPKMLKFITNNERLTKKYTQINGDKSVCLTARMYASWNGQYVAIPCDYRSDEGLRIKDGNKSGTLCARAREDESCGQLVIQIAHGYNKGGVFTDKAPTLTSNCYQNNNYIQDGWIIRRFTPREVLRLQTVPEWIIDKILSSGISDSQIYKMAGNGWTIEVIKLFINQMKSKWQEQH
jgi:DNA-cytosine methyltransferase